MRGRTENCIQSFEQMCRNLWDLMCGEISPVGKGRNLNTGKVVEILGMLKSTGTDRRYIW